MVKEVWPYLTVGLLLTVILAAFAHPAAAVAAGLLTLFIVAFFRDPRRRVRKDASAILSPADGKVVTIQRNPAGHSPGTRCVSIFLSVFNVHVNRSPVEGRITRIHYNPGSFLPAFREKASELNEQNLITMETARGTVSFKQIAGLIARRIKCWKNPGDMVGQGEKIGFITFGSRVDLFVPPEAEITVQTGERVRGGKTVMAVYRTGEEGT